MVVQKFVSKENWVGSRVVPGMKTIFFAIFDPIWTHILAPQDSNKEFFKQNFSFQSIRKTERVNSVCFCVFLFILKDI